MLSLKNRHRQAEIALNVHYYKTTSLDWNNEFLYHLKTSLRSDLQWRRNEVDERSVLDLDKY